jgi:hypothetical protein
MRGPPTAKVEDAIDLTGNVPLWEVRLAQWMVLFTLHRCCVETLEWDTAVVSCRFDVVVCSIVPRLSRLGARVIHLTISPSHRPISPCYSRELIVVGDSWSIYGVILQHYVPNKLWVSSHSRAMNTIATFIEHRTALFVLWLYWVPRWGIVKEVSGGVVPFLFSLSTYFGPSPIINHHGVCVWLIHNNSPRYDTYCVTIVEST